MATTITSTHKTFRIGRICIYYTANCLFWTFVFILFVITLLKWVPILFTPTMFFKSIEAYRHGEDSRIFYQWVAYSDMPEDLKLAVIASEDQRFPKHCGLDFIAISQAIEENKTRRKPRGASTISQQVAKNVFLWQGGGYFRKALEVPLTFLIEVIWGKERILEVYLNVAEMGPQTYGVQAASKRFFQKIPKQLSAAEAATLAAVLPNPTVYLAQSPSPYIQKRKSQILYQMKLLGGNTYLQNMGHIY